MRRFIVFALALFVSLSAWPAAAKKKDEAELSKQLTRTGAAVERLANETADLELNYAWEIDERDRLMLRRRFVEGREFYYELGDYRGAAEIFYSIINHPLASTLPNHAQAIFYLAESLFHSKYFLAARSQYQRIVEFGASDYYVMSMTRLIEMAVQQSDWVEAERLYSVLIANSDKEEDGSLGRYIMGKGYGQRGEYAKAVEVFDSIPETGAYYATAQYYAAVLFLKENNYRESVNRLRRLKKFLKEDVPNRDKLFALTHLALGRIHYEMNDFPQAMANYYAVPPESVDYPDSLYESIWVFITRNDYLLETIEKQRSDYEELIRNYVDFHDTLEFQRDRESVEPLLADADLLDQELAEMKQLFDEIDKSLIRLQEEAILSFDKFLKNAPNHPLLPEAELLVGNIYSQAEDFEKAERWFLKLKAKYNDFYASIRAARGNLTPGGYIELVGAASYALADGVPPNESSLQGIPAETAYWLAINQDVQKIFALYDQVTKERESVLSMREMIGDIEEKLREMETGSDYPILREANRKRLAALDEIQALQVDLLNYRNEVTEPDEEYVEGQSDPDKAAVIKKEKKYSDEYRNAVLLSLQNGETSLVDLQGRLMALGPQIDAKRDERLAFFREELARLRSPLDDYSQSVDALMSTSGGTLVQVSSEVLSNIERRTEEYAQKADVGVIDVAWRSTRGSAREIRKINQEMDDEIRRMRRQKQQEEMDRIKAEEQAKEEAAAAAPEGADSEEAPAELPPEEEAPEGEP